ncbi:MAG TPA: hypothetical protein DCY13_03710 [Verrucomicrobiales bacterium]|nr:hypothetical protein [Verrucomicrobiales bacterium]
MRRILAVHFGMNFPLRIIVLLALLAPPVMAAAADAPASFAAGPLTFTRPGEWIWVAQTSPMRKAELKVESADKKQAAEVVFFHFGAGQGGGVQANVERWYGQFAEGRDKINARSENKTVNGIKITYVFAEGTYLSGPPFGQKVPMKDHALVGAIVEDPGGSVFVKMTGPKELTKSAEPAFRKMVESARK